MLNLSLETLATWKRLLWAKCPVKFSQATDEAMCTRCGGTGLRWPQLSQPCPAVWDETPHPHGCMCCDGRGRITKEPTLDLVLPLLGRDPERELEEAILALAETLLGAEE